MIERGFDRWGELKNKLKDIFSVEEMPNIDPTSVEKYSHKWKTVRIPFEKEKSDIIKVDDMWGNRYATLCRGFYAELYTKRFHLGGDGKLVIKLGKEEAYFPMLDGEEYVFGRIPSSEEVYYLNIKPSGKYEIGKLRHRAPKAVSEIQLYVKREGDKLIIAKLGRTSMHVYGGFIGRVDLW